MSLNGIQSGQNIYLSGRYSEKGIASLSDIGGTSPCCGDYPVQVPCEPWGGSLRRHGSHGRLTDQACTQPVGNSPQTVQVQYTVTGGLMNLTSLTPSSAIASGAAFTLTVNGTNFTPQSTVLWNGSPRSHEFDARHTIDGADHGC